jgi:hypothetical protein
MVTSERYNNHNIIREGTLKMPTTISVEKSIPAIGINLRKPSLSFTHARVGN